MVHHVQRVTPRRPRCEITSMTMASGREHPPGSPQRSSDVTWLSAHHSAGAESLREKYRQTGGELQSWERLQPPGDAAPGDGCGSRTCSVHSDAPPDRIQVGARWRPA